MSRPKPKPKPPQSEIAKIKKALNLRASDPLPRCRGRVAYRVKKFEKAGNNDHSAKGHLCDECQCHHVAGFGTDHYGVGYCIHHESSIHYKGHAEQHMHDQKIALQQGYPDNVYKYQSSSRYLKAVRMAADEAKGRSDLKEELSVIRTVIQEVIEKIDEKIHDDDDLPEKEIKLLDKLSNTVAKLAKTNLEITDTDYVHIDQVKQWAYQIVRAVQDIVIDVKQQEKLIGEFAKIAQPKAGKQ